MGARALRPERLIYVESHMRIAFYAPLKPPTHATPSGDRRVARLLLQALQIAGHDPRLASDFRSFDGSGDALRQERLRAEGAEIADVLLKQWRNGPATERPELWFSYHLYYKAPDWLGPPLSAALGIPYVLAEASYAPKRAGGAWAIGHDATRSAIAAAAVVFCPTRDDLACVRLAASEHARVEQLAPFLDPALYRMAAQSRARHRVAVAAAEGLDSGLPWLLVPAMMRFGDKLASYRMLADALSMLAAVPWQLVVAGDGPARAEVEHLLAAAAPGRVRYLGLCGQDAMARLYAACDLCIWPAVNEAYGMAMLEAQAAGLPVVSCAVRGVPDVVCDGLTGLLAAPGDTRGLADNARRLLRDAPRRAAMGEAAARFVDQQRSTAQAAGQLNLAFAALRMHAPMTIAREAAT